MSEGIIAWLANVHPKARLAGVIFTHQITDDRIMPSSCKYAMILRKLCKRDNTNPIALVTTHWTGISEDVGEDRLADLVRDSNSRSVFGTDRWIYKHRGGKLSAFNIVSGLIDFLGLRRDSVNKKLALDFTSPETALREELLASEALSEKLKEHQERARLLQKIAEERQAQYAARSETPQRYSDPWNLALEEIKAPKQEESTPVYTEKARAKKWEDHLLEEAIAWEKESNLESRRDLEAKLLQNDQRPDLRRARGDFRRISEYSRKTYNGRLLERAQEVELQRAHEDSKRNLVAGEEAELLHRAREEEELRDPEDFKRDIEARRKAVLQQIDHRKGSRRVHEDSKRNLEAEAPLLNLDLKRQVAYKPTSKHQEQDLEVAKETNKTHEPAADPLVKSETMASSAANSEIPLPPAHSHRIKELPPSTETEKESSSLDLPVVERHSSAKDIGAVKESGTGQGPSIRDRIVLSEHEEIGISLVEGEEQQEEMTLGVRTREAVEEDAHEPKNNYNPREHKSQDEIRSAVSDKDDSCSPPPGGRFVEKLNEAEKLLDGSDNESEQDSDNSITEEEVATTSKPPNIIGIENFSLGGDPSQILVVNLCMFLLPTTLIPLVRVLSSISAEHIWFSTKEDQSLSNRIKSFAEDHAEGGWDWWPLRPRMKTLQTDQIRIHWKCVSIPSPMDIDESTADETALQEALVDRIAEISSRDRPSVSQTKRTCPGATPSL